MIIIKKVIFTKIKESIGKCYSMTLINNKKGKGFLYSYVLGVLSSIREYILIL